MDVCLLWVLCVVQVQASAAGRSLVQGSPTDCGVSECDLEASIMRRPKPEQNRCATKNGKHSATNPMRCCMPPRCAVTRCAFAPSSPVIVWQPRSRNVQHSRHGLDLCDLALGCLQNKHFTSILLGIVNLPPSRCSPRGSAAALSHAHTGRRFVNVTWSGPHRGYRGSTECGNVGLCRVTQLCKTQWKVTLPTQSRKCVYDVWTLCSYSCLCLLGVLLDRC
jgi:hypothetical protein